MSSESHSELKFDIGHVLFIDIVGYSKLLLVEQSDQIQTLREIVRGTEQFKKADAEGKLLRLPTGDGGALVFRNSLEAPVLCALEISKALKSHPELKVRMGIHSGPVNEITDLNEQANIAGVGINMAQRVMDCGDAGHILLSKRVADDLEQYPQWRSRLSDLGECEVKHGARMSVVNLYTDDAGNREPPQKFAKQSSLSAAIPASPPRRRSKLTITAGAVLVLVVIGGGLWFLSRQKGYHSIASTSSSTSVAAIPEKSIAVLPFDNLSRDPDNAYFSEGVQDEILTRLAKLADLKVISRTSTQRFKSAPADLRDIAKQLGVMHIVEGSVQKANDQVRVNVQLINAMTDAHLWADTYDRKLTDLFAVESEIAKTIADMLQAKLSGSEKMMMAKRATENSEAYELYLKGRHFWNRRTEADLRKALEFFEQAITKDPSYALAYAGAADCWSVMPNYSNDAPKQYIDRAIPLARRAIELDDSLAEGHAALANAIGADMQLAACEVEFKRAFALNPNYASAHQWYGEVLQSLGRFEEATAELRRAHDVDPLSLIINAILASTLYSGGHYEQALEQIRRTLDLDPDFNVAYWARGQINESMGNLDQAIADYTRATTTGSPSDPSQAMIACVYARSGRRAEADKILNELINESQRRFVSSYALAQINAVLGNKDEAIRLLEKAYDERSIPIGGCGIGGPKIDNRFDALRNDPVFQNFVAKFIGEAK